MTFEEAKARLDAGALDSLPEVAEILRGLSECQKRVGVYIVLALFDSRRLYTGPRWSKWAAEEYRLADEKDALHRANVGEMLRAVEERLPRRKTDFMELGISLLLQWAKLFNYGKMLLAHQEITDPCIPIANFLKAHPDAFGWKRKELDRAIRLFLPHDEDLDQPELNLTFDAVGAALDDDELAALTHREDFDGTRAFIMANNGAKLCTHAIAVIVKDHGELTTEALADIDRQLSEAHNRLRAIIIHRQED